MSTGSPETLRRIVEADDLHIAPFREDGEICGTPTWTHFRRIGRESGRSTS